VKKLIVYTVLGMLVLSSCGKKESFIEPSATRTIESNSSSITLNNYAFIKSADVYATQVEQKTDAIRFHSSFDVNNHKSRGNLAFEITSVVKTLKTGDYMLSSENEQAIIKYISNGITWKSSMGHQKGSIFKILSSKDLEAASGYVKEATVQVNCFLYNAKGENIPFTCITQIKF